MTGLAWSPDGSKLATFVYYTSVITIWNASDWQIIREFRRVSNAYSGNNFVWLPNGQILAAAAPRSQDETRFSLSLFDPVSGTLVKNIVGPTDNSSLQHNQAAIFAVSKDGRTVAMTNYRARWNVFLLDSQTWSIIKTLPVPNIPTALSFNADGELAVGMAEGTLEIFDLARDRIATQISAFSDKLGRGIGAVDFSLSGAFLAAAPTLSGTSQPLDSNPVRIWKVSSDVQIASLGNKADSDGFAQLDWSPNGLLLSAISYEGWLSVWRIEETRQSVVFETHFPVFGSAASFSKAGVLAAATGDHVVILK